ncbi:MAG: homoserine dehydrogenase [SAR324 cluster bacterium]|nr:homoserine dehydrogenase [SAR324 cluster bacterium]
MNEIKQINIGLFGVGVVGQGVIEQLAQNAVIISKRTGLNLKITKAVTKTPLKERAVSLEGISLSDDPEHILNDPEIDIVLELIGGIEEAEAIVIRALKDGKSVVSANKALIAENADNIFKTAYESRGLFGFEAAVAGGIPIIRDIKEGFSGDDITEISGIINGTANYILTQMTKAGKDFGTALKEAQEAGFAEADPTFDIEGVDTAHKLLLLMKIAFNGLFEFKELYTEGITKIESIDIAVAEEFGFVIKLLGKAVNVDGKFQGRVHPCLVSKESLLSGVNGAFNAVALKGNFVGETLTYGAGAGSHPTASAVVSDVVAIARQLKAGTGNLVPPLSAEWGSLKMQKIQPISETVTAYYLRFTVTDEVGVLAKITKILGDHGISIEAMQQKDRSKSKSEAVPVVIFTHQAKEENVAQALSEIDALTFIKEPTKLIRIDL